MSKITVTTIAGQTSGADANKVKIESGDTLQVESNATVGGTLTTTGASTFTGGLKTGATAGVSSAPIATIISGGNSLEWGHGNSAGYRSTLGALSGGGQPFIAWSAEHGTNANTYRTRGLKGHVIQTNNAGDLQFKAIQTANADNQTGQQTVQINNDGYMTSATQPRFCAYISGSSPTFSSLAENAVVPFNSVNVNTGNHYSTTSKVFTAPIAGTYWFGITIRVDNVGSSGSDYFHPFLGKNGSSSLESSLNGRLIVTAETQNIFSHVSGTWLVQLAANDTIGLYHGDANSAGGNAGSAYYQAGQCNFSGYLLA